MRLLIVTALLGVALSLDCDKQQQISEYLLGLLRWKAKNYESIPGDTAADWARLCFHDAGTWNYKTGSGGAHACIWNKCEAPQECEWNTAGNAGLQPVADELEYYYQKEGHYKYLSRADYWHLACKVGIEWASGFKIHLRYQWGRTDCLYNKFPLFKHPDAKDGIYSITKFLINQNGFTWEEAIALLGCHSLGRAKRSNSGYSGRWVPSPANSFSNYYYKVLLEHKWYRVVVPGVYGGPDKYQFVTRDSKYPAMMLFTDVATQWEIGKGSPYGCNVTQKANSCPKADTSDIVERFADDEAYWYSVFSYAWDKLEAFGGDELYENEEKQYWAYDQADYWAAY